MRIRPELAPAHSLLLIIEGGLGLAIEPIGCLEYCNTAPLDPTSAFQRFLLNSTFAAARTAPPGSETRSSPRPVLMEYDKALADKLSHAIKISISLVRSFGNLVTGWHQLGRWFLVQVHLFSSRWTMQAG